MFTVAALAAALVLPASPPGITWGDCDSGHTAYRCASFQVPMSYRDPGGPKIQLALSLLPATDQRHKIGTIFYNPGGPGASGRFAPPLTPTIHERFDIVGFDPRGVGASTTVQCFNDPSDLAPLGRVFGTFPAKDADIPAYLQDARAVTDMCARNAGPLLGHLSTANVARDLDRIRAAIGEPKLRYYGLSYGTVLGEQYANLFPQRVGSMTLDAVDDPVNWATGYRPQDAGIPLSVRLGGYKDAQRALDGFVAACDCGIDFDQILDRLEQGPVTVTDPDTGAPETFTYQSALNRVHSYLTDADDSPKLAALLHALANPTTVQAKAATPTPTSIPTQVDSLLGGGATVCEDTVNPTDQSAWPRAAARADQEVRGFGKRDTYITIPCATWPASDPDVYRGPWNRPTKPILLLSNKQGDPETPYEGARRTERLLGNARLLALDTFGHGSLGKSACVDAAVDSYFLGGHLPPKNALCQPNHKPFTGSGR
nr:alpha/beta hydrolase [Actinocrispum wychmicini]